MISCDVLSCSLVGVLGRYGVPEADSRFIVETMVNADAAGYKEHGTIRMRQLVDGLEGGTVTPVFAFDILEDRGASYVIDALHSIGQVSSRHASMVAVQRAMEFGVGISGVINASHIGCLSYYTQLISENECIGIAVTVSSPVVALPGGKKRILGTNPIAYSIPSDGYPITADFSTSMVSRGTVLRKAKCGEPIPTGWCVDKDGNPANDPNVINDGGCLLPFGGGIKASALSLFISVVAGPLIGGVNNIFVEGTRYSNTSSNKGDVFIAIHIPHFSSIETFKAAIEELKGIIENDESDFRVPGKRAFEARSKTTEIEIDQSVVDLIENISKGGIV
ncbi:MAG: Ldh family oxidoreductase [Holosporales bacterium]|jgi:L-2-hydroxycarboxylate dehydrogenase (NAD+)|nr:Ldh family oxidoreductase [Holosporales bacterium]